LGVPVTVLFRIDNDAGPLYERLLQERPAGERWSLIVEEGERSLRAGGGVVLHQIAPGCACCAGNLALRTTLARALRHDKADRIVIELGAGSHRERVMALLNGPMWAAHIEAVIDAGAA
jgi:G3E family GTPase